MKNSKYLLRFAEVAVYVLIGGLGVYFFYQQAINAFPSDMAAHLSIVDRYMYHDYHIPNPVFHLMVFYFSKLANLEYYQAGPIIVTFFLLVTVYLVHWVLVLLAPKTYHRFFLLLIAVSLVTVIAIYVPAFNLYYYAGQWSPNIWHSPNMLIVKPFALLAFVYYMFFLEKPENFRLLHYVLIAVSLVVVTLTKPNFAITFIPAIGIYLLVFRTRELMLYLKTFSMILPTLLILAYQYMQTFQLGADTSHYHDKIIFTNLGVLELYTPNVFISVLLVIAFPLAVIALGGAGVFKNRYLQLAWIHTLVAFLQAAFLAEQKTFDQAGFVFGYVMALSILYLFSMQEVLGWWDRRGSQIAVWRIGAVSGVYLLHLVSGIVYLMALFGGSSFL